MKRIAWGTVAIILAISGCSTDAPTPQPSPTPTPAVTQSATPSPSDSPTPDPTPEPSPEPTFDEPGNLVDMVGVTVEASATAPGSTDASGNPVTYEPANVLDGDPSTAWRTDWDWNSPYLLIRFDEPVEMHSIGLIPGYAKIDPATGTDRFPENFRVAYGTWTFSNGTSWVQEPEDEPTMQSIPVSGDVEWIRFEVGGINGYDWSLDDDEQPVNVAISELSLIGTPATP